MQKFLRTLMLLALMLPFASQAQTTLTVHDGTATNDSVPVYGYYADSYLRCQMVYPAAELSVMTGGTISGMTFYASQSSVNWGVASFEVKLTEIESATLSDYDGSASTTVYTGSLSISGNQMTVTFTTPYTYHGGNLLVEVDNLVEGTYVTSTWYGERVAGASVIGYSYSDFSSISGYQRNFLPKTTFTYYELPDLSACAKVNNLAIDTVTYNSMTLSWVDTNSAATFRVYALTATDTTLISGATGITDSFYTVTGLNANTTYTFGVKADCGETDGLSNLRDVTGRTLNNVAAINTFTASGSTIVRGDLVFDTVGHAITVPVWYTNSLSSLSLNWTLSDHADGMYVDTANDGSYTCKVNNYSIKNYLKMRTPLTVRVKAEVPTFYADYTITLAAEDCVKDRNFALTPERIRYTATWDNPDTLVTTHYFINSPVRLTADQLSGVNYVIVNNAHEYTVEGLERGTQYFAYVKSACDTTWLEGSVTTNNLATSATVIVAQGTSTTNYVPVYGYNYDNPQRSQSIYPASMLTELVGKTITGVQYQISGSDNPSSWYTGSYTDVVLNVNLAITEQENLSSAWDATEVTNVYTGQMAADGTIVFDQPFTYNGGNLLVNFEMPNRAAWKRVYFYGVSSTGGSRYADGTSYATASGSVANFLPMMAVAYSVTPNACPDVTNIAVDSLSHDFARIEWTASDADYCVGNQIIVSPTVLDEAALANATGAVTLAANATSYDATGLTPEHDYYVYVKALCNGEAHPEGVSGWASFQFQTYPAVRVPVIVYSQVSGKHSAQVLVANTGIIAGQPTNFSYVLSTTALDSAALATATPTVTGIDTMIVEINNLNSDTKYFFAFRNELNGEVSHWSTPDSVTTPVAMPAVRYLQVTEVAHNAMTAIWQPNFSQFADETAWRAAIVLHGQQPAAADWQTVTTTIEGTNNTYNAYNPFIGLIADTAYDIYVAAFDVESGATSDTVILDSVRTAEFPGTGIVVANGTTTNAYLPVYGNYADAPQRSQSLYPASMLSALQGQSITAMTYFANGSSFTSGVNKWANKPFTVSLKVVEQDNLATAWADTTGATVVYTGDLAVDETGMMLVTFAQPFTYTGGNLLVSFNLPDNVNSNYKNLYFYGTTIDSASRYGYQSSYSSAPLATGAVLNFLPKVMFDYAGASTCLPVSTIYVMDVTDANANAIWYPGNEENAWEYALSTSDSMTAAELEAAALPVTTNNVALSGLVRDTNYTFYIRPVCSDTEKGFWSHQTFTTPHVNYYYDVTVNVNDDEMGEVEGLTHVLEGTDTILVAEANLGYHFVNWTMGATVLGTNDTLEVTVDSNMTIMANFASDTFHITFAVNDATMGTISPAGVQAYVMNDPITITATPNMGYHLVGWNLTLPGLLDTTLATDVLTYEDTISFMWDGVILTAIFEQNDSITMTFGVNYAAAGSISLTGEQHPVEGTILSVTATPNAGYHLAGWLFVDEGRDTLITEIGLTYSDTVETYMDSAKVFAVFAKDAPLPVEATIAASDIEYKVGTGSNEAVIAVNWADTAFAWAVKFNGSITVQDAMDTIAAYDSRFNYTVGNFGLENITFTEGDLSFSGNAMSYWESNNGTDAGLGQALTNGSFEKWAQPEAGVWVSSYYTVDWNWWSPVYVYDMNITPMWTPAVLQTVTITFAVNDASMGSIEPNGTHVYTVGETVNVTATANEGYHLASWHLVIPMLGVDTTVSAESELSHPDTVSAYLDGATFTANFERDAVSIDDVETVDFTVYSVDNTVVVKGVENMNVYLFDVNGRSIEHMAQSTETVEFTVPSTGVYLVKVGNAAAKRVVVIR